MTAEELSALIKDEIGEDARLHAILDRIRDGKANLTDSELYAAITARITAQQMRRNVLSLDKREAAFVGITRERYTDTFTVFSAVQRILDAENGIHIKPQKPPFEDGRAHKIGHSLEDRTVPDSTIERRARSATENFCMSHHDDCMRANAEFRARAGLQSYAIREGGAKCCDWCADVSGKYPANETPAGFWGRHDNCKCSILYESKRSGRQLLRGAEDNTRRWEVVPENAGAEPLVRLTHEQAAAIQERNRLTVLTHEQVAAVGAGAVHVISPEEAAAASSKNPLHILTADLKYATMESAGSRDDYAAKRLYIKMAPEQRAEVIMRGIREPKTTFSYNTSVNQAMARLEKAKPEPNTFDVRSHGTEFGIEFFKQDYPKDDPRAFIDAYTLATILRGRDDFKAFIADCKERGVQPIVRILACNTGNTESTGNCFAQLLANEIGIYVSAPTRTLYANHDGSFYVGKKLNGEMKTFFPRK